MQIKIPITGFCIAGALSLLVCGIIVLSVVSRAAMADSMQVRGSAVSEYDSGNWGSDPSEEDLQRAQMKAKAAAWNAYTATFIPSLMQQYLPVRELFLQDLDLYMSGVRVLDTEVDEDASTITVVVRVSINVTAVEGRISQLSVAANTNTGEGSVFVFIFLARQASSTKVYEDKKVSVAVSESATSNQESAAISETEASVSTTTSEAEKTTTGGSVERKRAKTVYEVESPQDVNSAMGDVLTSAGFEVVMYDDVVSMCGGAEPSEIKAEFAVSDDMSRKLRKSAIIASKDCEVSYFSVGTLDVGVQDTDPVTGDKRVYVSVRSQVWDIRKGLPKTVASVGPVQYSGLGPDDAVAKRNALALAAKEVAKTIVHQMNAKGLN